MPTTLQDIADRVGVSKMTVSRILRGQGRFSPATRERVLQVARELGYRPNSHARSVRSGRSGCIALAMSTDIGRSHLPPLLLAGIHDELAKSDFHLLVSRLSDKALTDEESLPRILRELSADGMLLNYTDRFPEGLVELVRRYRIPSVWINCKLPADCVHPDDIGGSAITTRHFLELGHRRIAYASYMGGKHYSLTDRWSGYERTMTAAGLQPMVIRKPRHIPRTRSHMLPFTAAWLDRPDRPTAVLTDAGAIDYVCWTAEMKGMKLPQDLSVATIFERQVTFTGLTLTTAVIPNFEVGASAVRMLLEKLKGGGEVAAQPVAYSLEIGESSAGPPA